MRFVSVCACINNLFFLPCLVSLYVYTSINLSLLVDGHLGCFKFEVIINKAAVNLAVLILWTFFLFGM